MGAPRKLKGIDSLTHAAEHCLLCRRKLPLKSRAVCSIKFIQPVGHPKGLYLPEPEPSSLGTLDIPRSLVWPCNGWMGRIQGKGLQALGPSLSKWNTTT